jgi:integrase
VKGHLLKTNKAGDKIDPKYLDTPGKHCDGRGLYVQTAEPGQSSYVFRHKNKWAGMGSAHVHTIEEARETAAKLWNAACKGQDPFALLKTLRGSPTAVGGKTFAEAMADYLAVKAPTWTASNKAAGLRRYAYIFGKLPAFTALPVNAIDQAAKNAALANWNGQIKVRKDVEHYIKAIIKHALTGEIVLKAVEVDHHSSMPFAQIPALFARLGALGTENAKALQFLILTGVRSSEVIGAKHKEPARWSEIDATGKLWVIRKERMKTRHVHRVPLSSAALKLLGNRKADNVPLFKTSSERALRDTLKECDGNGFKVHGFRTSLQEWGLATTKYDADLLEMCISHSTGGKTRKAYQRGDRLEQRTPVMQEWSNFLTGK